jgi:hypothetical protein
MATAGSNLAPTRAPRLSYRLTYRPRGSEAQVDSQIEAFDLEGAYAIAGTAIAANLGHPGAFVLFDRDAGEVAIGAGYRSWRCSFSLTPPSPDPREEPR